MDNRFQFVLLKMKAATLAVAMCIAPAVFADESVTTDISDINNEVFELGVFAGIINIEDFGSEFVPGISATFRASEDFFIQYNYLQTDVSPSSYENNQGKLFDGDDRTFKHYDLLIGYNLFQGEFFPSPPKANLSSLYVVGLCFVIRLVSGTRVRKRISNWQDSQFAQRSCPKGEPQGCGE